MIKEFNLDGKVAIVTGAGRGIGKEISIAMAEAGANLVLVSRTKEQIDNTAGYIVRNNGEECMAITADIRDELQTKNMVGKVISKFGKIDILVNNAGAFYMKPFLDGMSRKMPSVPDFDIPMGKEEWQIQMDTNVTGVFNLSRDVAKHMAGQKSGKIINISSIDALKGMAYHSAYSATKGAIIALTKNLAVELGRYNINVNVICPGFVHTDMTDFAHKDEEMRDVMIKLSPFRRLTKPRDVALLAVYLASEASDCITGQVICADNGVTC